jgi:hypothetical protein
MGYEVVQGSAKVCEVVRSNVKCYEMFVKRFKVVRSGFRGK